MPLTATSIFSGLRVDPAFRPDLAPTIDVPLAPGTYKAGTLVGQITGTNTNDVQTITVDACTHSTMTLYGLPVIGTYTAVQDVTTGALQTALNAAIGTNAYAVTGTYSAGAGGTYILTAGAGALTHLPLTLIGVTASFVGGAVPTIAVVHTTVGVGPSTAFSAYATGHSDGTQYPTGILAYPCTVDSGGVITMVGEHGMTYMAAPMYVGGWFKCEDLVGLDAGGLTAMAGILVKGSVTSGIMKW